MPDIHTDADLNEGLTLRLWDGDDSVKAELVLSWATRLEAMVRLNFPKLTDVDAEDVVAEAIHRFWSWRENYDPAQAQIQTVLYRLAERVACEYRSGRYKWQKARLRELADSAEILQACNDSLVEPPELEDEPYESDTKFLKAVKKAISSLPELQQEILEAFADADGYPLDAAILGIELGATHNGGVPIPAGTIRVYKTRAKEGLVKQLAKQGFDLQEMGYIDD